MQYEPNTIYHIYNQGNNRQNIFFEEENYLYFLKKMRKHLLPFGDLLAYCLMPNHFHWLFITNEAACLLSQKTKGGRKQTKPETHAEIGGTSKVPPILQSNETHQQQISSNIGTLLSGYTKAINKRYGRSGSLFRKPTKAKNGIIDGFITVNGKNKNLFFGQNEGYEKICFDYIHNNPVKAKMVRQQEQWKFSSAVDYAGLRNGTICNKALAKKLGLFSEGL